MNLEELAPIVVALAGGGFLASVTNSLFGRGKAKAEVESIEAETSIRLLKGVTEEIGRLQTRIGQLETKLEADAEKARKREEGLEERLAVLRTAYQATRDRVDYLTAMVRRAGLDISEWTPPSGVDLGG